MSANAKIAKSTEGRKADIALYLTLNLQIACLL